MTKFTSDLNKAYKTKAVGTLEKKVRAVALLTAGELIKRTPVKIGRARANWQPSLNEPETREVKADEANPKAGDPPSRKQEEKVLSIGNQYDINDRILITNNLPYIKPLNNGSSTQSPAGFVEASVAFVKGIIK